MIRQPEREHLYRLMVKTLDQAFIYSLEPSPRKVN